jgi:hypothetical protein
MNTPETPQPTAPPEPPPTFTTEEVSAILCQGCRFNIRSSHAGGVFTHTLNGVSIPCKANRWRTTEARKKSIAVAEFKAIQGGLKTSEELRGMFTLNLKETEGNHAN